VKFRLPLAFLLCFCAIHVWAMPALAVDKQVLAAGAKDEDRCNEPLLGQRKLDVFSDCLKKLEAGYAGKAEEKNSYLVGLYFQGWSVANLFAAADDNDFFPEVKKRSATKPERQLAMKLFDRFRPLQKKLKISDADLATAAGYDLAGVKPHLDYYDKLPKK